MLQPNFAVYLGKEKAGGFFGVVAQDNLFLIIEVEDGMDAEIGREIIQKIKDEVASLTINKLASFDQFISQIITKYNFPTSLTLAAVYVNERILYLKTVGQGKIFLNRGRDFAQIIEKDNSASGYIENSDFFILTNKRLIDLLGSDIELKTIFDHKNPHEIVEELAPQLKGKGDEGIVTLFIQFEEVEIEQDKILDTESQESKEGHGQIKDAGKTFFEMIKSYSQSSSKSKIATFIAVIIIFFILIWSVVLGYKRRNEAEAVKKVKVAKELIIQKLDQAEEGAFLNLPKSQVLISEAKQEIDRLKKQLGKQREKEIKELEELIKDKEGKIVKKEEKNFEEFYDLTIDGKEAKGSVFFLEKDKLSIIDRGKGIIYLLSLSKKSLEKKSASEIKKADLVSTYQEDILFYVRGEGIYKISGDEKAKKAIDKDKDWGNIVDMWIYNGNVYLLDRDKGDIYKYLVAESGYSTKSSYLKGEAGNAKGANSFSIDASVYIGFDDSIMKFTAGARDGFATSWPEKNVSLAKIFTSADVEKVYGWDKSKGAIYILGKNGAYERQINSSILTKASDFVVFKDIAYVIVSEKIYRIGLD